MPLGCDDPRTWCVTSVAKSPLTPTKPHAILTSTKENDMTSKTIHRTHAATVTAYINSKGDTMAYEVVWDGKYKRFPCRDDAIAFADRT